MDALDGTTKQKDESDPGSGHEEHHVRPSPVHPHAIVDCENLLESYLMQVLAAPFGQEFSSSNALAVFPGECWVTC